MKRKLIIIALVLICAATLSIGTVAYHTVDRTAKNVITTGNVEIKLNEYAKDANGALVPFEDVDGIMPGMNASKIVTVENTGSSEAWVRLKTSASAELQDKQVIDATDVFQMDINTEKWTEKDGWYYYNEKLAPGEATEPLFTEVNFAVEMDNVYQESKLKLDITANGTQTAHNGETVLQAAGWPEEN